MMGWTGQLILLAFFLPVASTALADPFVYEEKLRNLGVSERVVSELKQAANLHARLQSDAAVLRGLRGEELQSSPGAPGDASFLANHRNDLLHFSDLYHDYRVLRTRAVCRMVYELLQQAPENVRGRFPTEMGAIKSAYEKFIRHADQSVVLMGPADRSGKDYKDLKAKQARRFSDMMARQVAFVRAVDQLIGKVRNEVEGRRFAILKKTIAFLKRAMVRTGQWIITRRVGRGENPFLLMQRYLELKFEKSGFPLVYEYRTHIPENTGNSINIIIPPHGSSEEVGTIASTVVSHLHERGEKTGVIMTPFDMLKRPGGEQIVRSVIENPYFLCVYNDNENTEKVKESGKFPLKSIDVQFKEAIERGIRNFVIFAEGRGPGFGGGITNSNPDTFTLQRILLRQLKGVDIRTVILSATLPNFDLGYGAQRAHRVIIDHASTFSGDPLKEIVRKADGAAALTDFLWIDNALEHYPSRLGGTAPVDTLLEEIIDRHDEFFGVCRNIPS